MRRLTTRAASSACATARSQATTANRALEISKMKAYLTLFRRFILRALAREKLRTMITALGIALGVGVTVAIRLANASALESFRAATRSVVGQTSIQITGAAGRFDELLLRDLNWLREYGDLSPVITGYAMTDPQAAASATATPSA